MKERQNISEKYTRLRAAVKVCRLPFAAAALVFLLPLTAHADPVSGALASIWTVKFFVGLAVSTGVSIGASSLVSLLNRPKPLRQGARSGDVLIQDSEYGRYITEVYGARVSGKGGVKHSGNIIDASSIRKTTSTSTVEQGGKGGPKQKVEKTDYWQDLDIAFGRGRQRFLKIWFIGAAGAKLVYDVTQTTTGVIDPDFPVESPYDHFLLPNPQTPDTNPSDRYSLVPVEDAEETIEVRLLDGTYARLYSGSDDQLPDPLFEAIHGVGETPAYRGIAHIVFENLRITDGHPNIIVLSESKDYQTLDEIVLARSEMAGVGASDCDYSELSSKSVMGFIISRQQSPRSDMELLARVYDADFYEGSNGKINGALVDEDIFETIDGDYMGAVEGEGQRQFSPTGQANERDEVDLPFRIEFTASDPDNNHETATRHSARQVTDSSRVESVDLPLTLPTSELQKLANRELQEIWRADGGLTFTTPHNYRHLVPSKKILTPFAGENRTLRIKQITGSVPGILTVTCASAEGIVLESIGDAGSVGATDSVSVPANTVITLIDVPRVHSPQDGPGFMWAPVQKDYTSGEWSGAALYVDKGSGYQYVDKAEAPALLGRVVGSALADVPGGWTEGAWDATSSVTVDFFGEREPETLTEAQALDQPYAFAVGNEVVIIRSWASVGGHPNRWTGTNMQRRLKGTASTGHVTNERVVLLDSAVRFVRVDESEVGVARTYKAVTLAPTTPQRLEDAAEVDFTWTGETILVDDEITGTFTADTLEAVNADVDNIVSADIDGTLIKGAQVRIGTGGTTLTKMVKGTVTVNPASVAAGAVSSQNFTLTGAATGDSLQLNPPAAGLTAGLIVLQSWVSAADQISIVLQNTTGGAIDEPSASWTYTLIRS